MPHQLHSAKIRKLDFQIMVLVLLLHDGPVWSQVLEDKWNADLQNREQRRFLWSIARCHQIRRGQSYSQSPGLRLVLFSAE